MKSRILWSAVVAAGFCAVPVVPSVCHAQSKLTDEEVQQAVQDRFKSGMTLRAMEKAALEDDKKVIDAKGRMEQSDKEWAALQTQVDEAAKSDADYPEAQKSLEQAEDRVKQAKKTLADAVKAQAASEAAMARTRAQSRVASGGGGGGTTYTPRSTTPTVSPLASQTKAVKDAEDEVRKANLKIAQIKKKTQLSLESKDDWKAAKAARDKAHLDYDLAQRPVIEALRKKPQYAAVLKMQSDAQAKIDAANGTPGAH